MSSRKLQWFSLDIFILINLYSLYLIFNWDYYLNNILQFNIDLKFKTTLLTIITDISYNNINFWLDPISLIFIIVTTFLIPIWFISNWNTKLNASLLFFIFLIILIELNWILAFYTNDLFLFYIFFEFLTIPTFFCIYVYGGNLTKIRASILFLIYSLTSSTFLAIGISLFMSIYNKTNIFFIFLNYNYYVDINYNYIHLKYIILFILIGFAIKIPLVPFQVWLPEAHAEAPTSISIILAGIILKLGGFGLFRYFIQITLNFWYNINIIFIMCILSIIIIVYMCIKKQNIKQLMAYSSINHMGISVLGIISGNKSGIIGGIYSMLQHSLLASLYFYIAGIIYEKYHTYNINLLSNFLNKNSIFFLILIFATLINTAIPFTSWFVGEFFIMNSLSSINHFIFYILVINIILTWFYSFWLLNRIIYSGKKINLSKNYNMVNIDIGQDKIHNYMMFLLIFYSIFLGIFWNNIINFINL